MNWLIKNSPAVAEAIKAGTALIGTVDSWLVWNLSGGTHVTDVTNASRTLLMDLESLDWDEELLKIFEVPRSILPKICSSSEVYGKTLIDGPLGAAVPIAEFSGTNRQRWLDKRASSEANPKQLTAPETSLF